MKARLKVMRFKDFCDSFECMNCDFKEMRTISECKDAWKKGFKKNDYKKKKFDQDMIAMILADFQHGELTECTCECENCPLNKEMTLRLAKNKCSICNMLTEISELLNEVEYE